MPVTWFIVDVESDGPCPGLFSMVSIGIVKLDRTLETTFYGRSAPLDGTGFQEKALAISGTTREKHLAYPPAAFTTDFMDRWINETTEKGTKPVFVSDKPAFAWVNYYTHRFLGRNPFGFSERRIGDLYSGLVKDAQSSGEWKKFRKTTHNHDPVKDALGNAEAILYMIDNLGLKVPGVQSAVVRKLEGDRK